MPEYKVNLSDVTGSVQVEHFIPALNPHEALKIAREMAGPEYSKLVMVHEVYYQPALFPDVEPPEVILELPPEPEVPDSGTETDEPTPEGLGG